MRTVASVLQPAGAVGFIVAAFLADVLLGVAALSLVAVVVGVVLEVRADT